MHIAILEDNPEINSFLRSALHLAGHHVTVHTQGTSLLDALFNGEEGHDPLPYDLITVDLLLPGGLSGLDVIIRIRQALAPDRLPIIMITGAGQPDIEQVRLAFPELPILQKPFKLRVLMHFIEDVERTKGKQGVGPS